MSGILFNGQVILPPTIVAGDQIDQQDINLGGDYPASVYTLTISVRKTGVSINMTAAADGDLYDLTVASAVTANYAPGYYTAQAYVTAAGERTTIAFGSIEILTNYATQAAGYDGRTQNKKTLDALQAMQLGKASLDQLSMTIEGRSLGRIPLKDVQELIDKYQRLVDAEEAAMESIGGKSKQGLVRVHFGEP